jgi:hypothetical protein
LRIGFDQAVVAFARMEATDVNNIVPSGRSLALRPRRAGRDIERVIDGFQLCRANGELFDQISPTASETVTTLRPW